MKVLVHAHRFELGGSQTNAIELASRLRDAYGVESFFVAVPGPACELAEQRGLPFVPLPDSSRHPSRRVGRALVAAATRFEPDLVHTWDWPQTIESYHALHVGRGLPMLASSMSMVIDRILPRTVTTTFGTPQLADAARPRWRAPVELIEPPVDVESDAPGRAAGAEFRDAHGLDPTGLLVVSVSRLVGHMKLEGIRRAADAIAALAPGCAVQLAIVGEGPAAGALAAQADAINARIGRRVVVLTGALVDPAPAYEAADVVVGMGGSALRAMAFAKPVVVMGERGFSRVLDEDSVPGFVHRGFFGIGEDGADDPLAAQLQSLLASPARRAELGAAGRELVVTRYGVPAVAERLEAIYRSVVARRPARFRARREAARSVAVQAAGWAKRSVRR